MLAASVRLLEVGFFRIGSEEYATENDSYGLATLRNCTPEVYAALDAAAATVGKLASDALTAAGVPHRLSYAGNMFSIFFTDRDVYDYDTAKAQDTAAFKAFFHEMLARGETDWVFVDTRTGRPWSIPDDIKAMFEIQPADWEP